MRLERAQLFEPSAHLSRRALVHRQFVSTLWDAWANTIVVAVLYYKSDNESGPRALKNKGTNSKEVRTEIRSYLSQAALIAVTATFLTAATAWAGTSNHHESGNVDLIYASRIVNGPMLKAGTYRVELVSKASSPEVMFYQDGKLMGKAQPKLVNEAKKIDQTEIQYNTAGNKHVITEIDVHGWRQELKFPSSQSTAMGS